MRVKPSCGKEKYAILIKNGSDGSIPHPAGRLSFMKHFYAEMI
jgi:hypothetical protein